MAAPAVGILLDAWEDSLAAGPPRRAVGLLAAAHPTGDDPALLPLGERNIALLELRAQLFGDPVEALASCPACGAELDVAFTVSGLLASLPGPATERPESVVDGHTAVLRPLTSADALAALDAVDPAAELVARCLLCLTGPDGARLDAVPDALVGPLAAALAGIDPAALIEVGLSCAECGHGWGEPLDVGGFLWREVDAWARRTLREVHALAGAYGWREADILALTPARRAAYLHLVGE